MGSDQSTVRYHPSHESLFLSVAGEFCAAIDAELLIDIMEIDLDRSLADEEFLADLHIAQPRLNFPGPMSGSLKVN